MASFTTTPESERFVVDFWVTGRCDMECPFCYGADVPLKTQNNTISKNKLLGYSVTSETQLISGSNDPRPEMTFEQMKNVIIKLKAVGVTTLTFSGGEPLLRKEMPDLIKFAHEQSLEIYLSTNGTFLLQKYDLVKNHLSTLGLPLDGSNSEMDTAMGRKPYHFENIRNILRYFYANQPNHILKIGTIVSKINLHDIESIARLLFRNSSSFPPNVWRLYQFEALKEGSKNRNQYAITDKEFSSVCDSVKAKYPDVKIRERSRQEHSNSYFFVTPDGMLQTVTDKHVSIADLLVIDANSLKNYMKQHALVISRASQNRNWL